MLSKILAYGFLMHRGSYLRDAWCQLDFVVVSLAWVPIFFPSFGNYSVIRSVRALRPLRALKRVPGMPVLISSIMAAMPKLGNVMALCGFIFLVFGIVGMELFKGALHYRCATLDFVESDRGYLIALLCLFARSLLLVLLALSLQQRTNIQVVVYTRFGFRSSRKI